MIQVKHLTKYYGDKPGVEDVSFEIADGEVVGLLGPNGAGKSTLLKMLTGYHLPTSGEIYIDGIDSVENPKEGMAKIGFMPEIPPLYVDMTVRDFLAFCAGIRNVNGGKEKGSSVSLKRRQAEEVDAAMETASVTDVSGRLIRNLSKGYRQRVGLAQALIGRPEILIMDEPTVGLDPRQMAEFRQLISELGKTHTIIVSSHILSEISLICSRLLILSHGKLVAADTVENLEEKLRKGDSFTVKLKADVNGARKMILDIPGVMTVTDRNDAVSDNNHCIFSVEAEDNAVREKLFDAAAARHMPILELVSDRMSLEQVFLRLTGGDDGMAVTDIQ